MDLMNDAQTFSPARAGSRLLFAAVVLLAGCAYNHSFDDPPPTDPRYELHIVQSDDYGSLWHTSAAQKALDAVKDNADRTNTFVVLFIHGWNNNAAPDNHNLMKSGEQLAALQTALDSDTRRALRRCLTGNPDFRLVGIYIGWRGRTLPGPLTYLTFWGRKAAAERVGDGDVGEFIQHLQRIYVEAAATSAQTHRIMGLVTIGHSFGAQVLWRSLGRSIEAPLVASTKRMSDSLKAGEARPVDVTEKIDPIDSLGDLSILLNPAFEAYQFARVDEMYRRLPYQADQTPQVVVLSSENDKAREFWFPLARGAGAPFRPRFRSDGDDRQGQLYGHALGELPDQVTHQLRLSSGRDTLSDADYRDPVRIGNFDFSDDVTFSGVTLQRVKGQPFVANSPVVVASTSPAVIDGHNGIFEPELRGFLTGYISFIEGKRLILGRAQLLRGKDGAQIGQNAVPKDVSQCVDAGVRDFAR